MGFRLFDYLIKRRRTILATAVVFAVAGLLYILIADPAYESRAMLMPPMEEGGDGLLSAWMASMSLPSMIAPMTGGSMSAVVMVDILGSRGLAEKVVVEHVMVTTVAGQEMKMPPQMMDHPAKIEKVEIEPEGDETVKTKQVGEGDEEIDVNGK